MRSERQLIQNYLAGQPQAFFKVSAWISAVVRNSIWGVEHEWEDIIQDVHLKLYVNLQHGKFLHHSSLQTYVYRIAKYTCIDYLRRKKYRGDSDVQMNDIRDDEPHFESLVQKERKEALRQIMTRLPALCRQVLKMAFIEQLAYKRIAVRLGIAEGTVKSRVSRCIHKAVSLRRELFE